MSLEWFLLIVGMLVMCLSVVVAHAVEQGKEMRRLREELGREREAVRGERDRWVTNMLMKDEQNRRLEKTVVELEERLKS